MFELGNNLREARQRRRIDLGIAEQDTKIRSKYLAALETEDFDVLPGPVFVRGFLRTYSRYLGLDPQLFIDEYNARFGRFEEIEDPASPALGRPGLAQERDRRGRRTMRTVAVLSLVAVALLAWVGLRSEDAASLSDGAADVATSDEARDAGPSTSTSTSSPTAPAAGAGSFDAAAAEAAGTSTAPVDAAKAPRTSTTGTTTPRTTAATEPGTR